jgi:tetratricopeptide (TPR) repeat protein
MKLIRQIVLVVMMGASAWPAMAQTAADPEQLFHQAMKKYGQENYQEGVDLFAAALEIFPASAPPFDPALLHYNLGIGQFRLSKPDEAAQSFQKALLTPNIQLQGKAYYNLGNTQYQLAQNALNEGDVQNGFKLYQAAATNYMQALRLDSMDQNAKINYELSLNAQMRILQIVAMAMQQMQQGGQLVDQFKFVEAAQWFQQNYEQIDKALSLEPDVKKQFENMTQRTTAVAEILAPPAMPGGAP